MAFANRIECYICGNRARAQQTVRIGHGENMARVAAIAVDRRIRLNRPPLDIDNNTRICQNCYQNVLQEIRLEQDPNALRLNVLVVPHDNACCICQNLEDIHNLSVDCKVEIFIKCEIFCPEFVRACRHHLDERGYVLRPLLRGLQCINRLILIRTGYLQIFMLALPRVSKGTMKFNDIHDLTDDEVYNLTGLTREQFEELYTFCGPVPREGGNSLVHRKDLLMFLCKLKQGLSDEFLRIIFQYSTRQNTSFIVSIVRQSLMLRFVPENVGFTAITRQQYINEHVTEFANILYNPDPNNLVAIAIIDASYVYCFKSKNFRVQRQSFSTHKSRNLVKPALIVAPDGYILAVHGPYFSDGQNNDASIIVNEFAVDEEINEWFQQGDVAIVDRGYRDALEVMAGFGLVCRMPPLIAAGENQLNTEDANESRMITKLRWVVEARNGHMKSIFKFFSMMQQVHVLPNIGDYYRIGAAIINRSHPRITMESATPHLAHIMQERAMLENDVQTRVENEDLARRNAQRWLQLDEGNLNDFPELTLEFLEELTVGCYQVGLAPSYVQDKLQRDNNEVFQVEVLFDENRIPEPGFLRVRVYSRFRNNTRHQLWIHYYPNGNVENMPIIGYYCTCQCGTRTLGTCAHIASVLWYLGYARRHENVHYPSHRLLNEIEDAAQRPVPEGDP